MCQKVYKQAQTQGQILATTYSGLYSALTNKEIHDIVDLSIDTHVMDRVSRPHANTQLGKSENKYIFISPKTKYIHVIALWVSTFELHKPPCPVSIIVLA
jgi:hypothetical protein